MTDHSSIYIRSQTIRRTVAVASIFQFNLCSKNGSGVHLEGQCKLTEEVYDFPKVQLNVDRGQLLQSMRPLYRLF